jgi:(p)ppGpp synthase/HD superfamily hydrolase
VACIREGDDDENGNWLHHRRATVRNRGIRVEVPHMSTLTTPVSGRFHEALAYASEMHATQARKGSQIPYISHLMAVAGIIWEAGGDEGEAIAGLLHDGPEDQGGLERLADIRRRFGDRVGDIVEHCSDTFETPKPPWAERKRAYAESLRHADASTLLVSIADKLHNARATVADLRRADDPMTVWSKFSATREQTIGNYEMLIAAYESGTTDSRRVPLVESLRSAVEEMKRHR